MTAAPRLLIISRLFPPSRKIGARRPERFARHLSQRGWDVTVLTLHPKYVRPLDDDWTPPPGVRILRTHAFLPGNVLRRAGDAWHRLGELGEHDETLERTHPPGNRMVKDNTRPLRDAFWRSVSRVEFPDRWIGWKPFALAAARRLRFDAVLATLPPYSPALIARSIASRDGAVLALDYRDPWTEAPRMGWDPALYAHLLDRHRRLEDSCLQTSDVVLGASPTICRWLAPRAGIEPLFTPNSFDEREEPRPIGTRSRSLVYTGTLAYGRSLTPVLAAMSRIPAERDGGLELVYAGGDGKVLLGDAERAGLTGRIRDLGYLPGRESERILRGALAAVVVGTEGYEYALPGKLFEVLAAGVPMLLIAPADSDAARLCQKHRLGWHHVPEDIEGIATSLGQAAAGELPTPVDVEDFCTDHVVGAVDTALREALNRTRRAELTVKQVTRV